MILSLAQWSAVAIIALGYAAMFRQLYRWHRAERRALRLLTEEKRGEQDATLRAWQARRERVREALQ